MPPTFHAWQLDGADGCPILGDTHLPDATPRGHLILCHGFKGYKDYGFFPRLAHTAASHQLIAHRFNFSHSGMTNRIDTFEHPDRFERDTWSKQMHDLTRVARAIAAGELPGEPTLPQAWFGHSRGGVTVLLAARHLMPHGGVPAPRALILAAAPDSACNLDPVHQRLLLKQGYLESPSARTGQNLRTGKAWLEEVQQDPARFDPIDAIKNLEQPTLIIHGQDDPTVPVTCAHRLAQACPTATLHVIPQAQHTFNCPNPLPDDQPAPDATHEMIDTTCRFALDHLT